MNICVVGSGYVGLVTGACLADFGMHVVGVDKDAAKIAALQQGKVPIYEPGLEALVKTNMEEGRLSFSTDLGPAIEEARAVFIAVGTPPKSDGSADLTFIREVADSIGQHLNGYKVIVTKSTVPIGTGKMIEELVRAKTGGRQRFAVVSNPEFLREGSAIEDFMHPDRVVVGTRDPEAAEIMEDVYSPLVAAAVPFIVTDIESAELIKYASNGFLATKISFINEVAQLCEAWGANVEVVSKGMGLDNRIGSEIPLRRPRLRRLLLPQGHPRRGADRPRAGPPLPHHRSGPGGQRGAEGEDARQDRHRARRHLRPYGGGPRPLLQAEHGRHPRVAGAADRAGPGRPRRRGARLRSGGDGRLPAALPDRQVLREPLRGGGGSGRASHRHRVESVPQAGASTGCTRCSADSWSSICATSTSPRRWPPPASTTCRSVAHPRIRIPRPIPRRR